MTGSIVARAVKADVYENWTDVSGFLVADPRIIENPEAIETITYRELRELSYMGASVLHEDAIFPVRREGIPINIRNTNKPEDKGTLIVESTCRKQRYTITGIAGKKGFCAINIEKAFFIKYEFWKNTLEQLHRREIPTYLVSGVFRKNQLFFKPYGFSHRKVLSFFTHLFVQNDISKKLLQNIGIENASVAGDTRFDRVAKIAENAKELPLIKSFAENACVLVAGSTWEKDEKIILNHFNQTTTEKLIVVPHEISNHRIEILCRKSKRPYLRYSEATETNIQQVDCLIIDCFGLLSSIYRYATTAYVGGGFGVGIHNTLEAAVWEIPIIFGPNYRKAEEAKDLIACGGAFSVNSLKDFNRVAAHVSGRTEVGKQAGNYIHRRVRLQLEERAKSPKGRSPV